MQESDNTHGELVSDFLIAGPESPYNQTMSVGLAAGSID
jgi:hypothetical protein